MTRLGVLYCFIFVPEDTPEQYKEEILTSNLAPIDEAMTLMALEGIVGMQTRLLGSNDKKQEVYLIKFVPVFQKFGFWFLVRHLIFALIGYWLIGKLELWQYVDQVANKLLN